MGDSTAPRATAGDARPAPSARTDGSARTVSTAFFLLFTSMGVWVPYLPLYLATRGFDGEQIGFVLALSPAIRWSAAIPWAYAADHLRIRHRLFVAAAIGSTLALGVLATTDHFATIVAAVAAVALLSAPLVPMMDAMSFDNLPRLGGDYGRLRAWGSMGFIIGSVVAAFVIARTSPLVVPWLLFAAQAGLPIAAWWLPREQHGHAEHFRAGYAKLGIEPAEILRLAGAARRVIFGVKIQDQFLASKIRQGQMIARLRTDCVAWQIEIGGFLA